MKRNLLLIVLISIISLTSVFAQSRNYTIDTLSMNQSYANDIYYSMSEGEIASIPRAGWDIAFYTPAFSAGIIINEGSGVQLFSYPNGDTASWSHVDTAGFSTWKPLYNSPEVWEDGAFNKNALIHPDYGWGIYNQVTHDVIGDSLYIIKIPEVGFKKLWVVSKISVENTYNLKFADLDGANEQVVSLDIVPFIDKNFVYYSMTTDMLIDREPASNWDILFTKYIDLTQTMSGEISEYLVTGATSNVDHLANKFTEVGVDFDDWASEKMESQKNTIGYNWKSIDMSTYIWTVDDSTAFFVKDHMGDVYKLIFTYWAGSGSGEFALNKEIVSLSDLEDIVKSNEVVLYPNPANKLVNIKIDKVQFEGNIIISDISGRQIYSSQINTSNSIDVSELTNGIYFVTIYNNSFKETQKLIIN